MKDSMNTLSIEDKSLPEVDNLLFNNYVVNPHWDSRQEIKKTDKKHYTMILSSQPTSHDDFKYPFYCLITQNTNINYRLLLEKMLKDEKGRVFEKDKLEKIVGWVEVLMKIKRDDFISWGFEDVPEEGVENQLNSDSETYIQKEKFDLFKKAFSAFLDNSFKKNRLPIVDFQPSKKELDSPRGRKFKGIIEMITFEEDRKSLLELLKGKKLSEKIRINCCSKRMFVGLFFMTFLDHMIGKGDGKKASLANYILSKFDFYDVDSDTYESKSHNHIKGMISFYMKHHEDGTLSKYLLKSVREDKRFPSLKRELINLNKLTSAISAT